MTIKNKELMLFERLLKLPLGGKSSIFLFGSRGTGKTSWLKMHVQNSLYFDLLDFNTYMMLSSDPSKLDNLIPVGYAGWIIIDEVQRVPELLNEVHRLIEGKGLRFILTGSSARNLRKRGVNLLAGRALRYTMHPLIAQEIGEEFDLLHAVEFGLLPTAVRHADPKKYLESYVQTYVREEVLQEGLTRNIGSFARFLEVASFSQGSVLNISEIGRELGINRLVIANYFDILEDLLLAIRLPIFTQRAKRKMIAHQKFYFFDVGVFRALRPMGILDTLQEVEGAGLETLFLQSLRAVNDYYNLGYTIYFWRTAAGQEVDFVLYGPRGLHAFELKRSSTVTSKDFKGLNAFYEDYPEANLYILFFGKHTEYHGAIKAMSFIATLKQLHTIL